MREDDDDADDGDSVSETAGVLLDAVSSASPLPLVANVVKRGLSAADPTARMRAARDELVREAALRRVPELEAAVARIERALGDQEALARQRFVEEVAAQLREGERDLDVRSAAFREAVLLNFRRAIEVVCVDVIPSLARITVVSATSVGQLDRFGRALGRALVDLSSEEFDCLARLAQVLGAVAAEAEEDDHLSLNVVPEADGTESLEVRARLLGRNVPLCAWDLHAKAVVHACLAVGVMDPPTDDPRASWFNEQAFGTSLQMPATPDSRRALVAREYCRRLAASIVPAASQFRS